MIIKDIPQAERELQKLYLLAKERLGDDKALVRMQPLLAAAGNPHEKLKVIHVAGTSGKTSTSYYIAALLNSAGQKVGLSVSPHVDSITERLQINGQPISELEFCSLLGDFMDITATLEVPPSYFELMIVFVLWVFDKKSVDYAVMETGMGGLYDATNVVTRADKISVITDIGLDHTNVFGKDLKKIAAQKAGIIHPGNQVFMIEQIDAVMEVVRGQIEQQKAKLKVVRQQDVDSLPKSSLPEFQGRNWCLSETVFAAVAERDHLGSDITLDPLTVVVPGRMETKTLDDGTILIQDGAHNAQKIAAFVSSFQKMYPGKKAAVLLALKEGKETAEVLDNLAPIVGTLISTAFKSEQDFPIVSQDPAVVATIAKDLGIKSRIIRDKDEAYKYLLDTPAQIKLVIGSIYLLGQIREHFDE